MRHTRGKFFFPLGKERLHHQCLPHLRGSGVLHDLPNSILWAPRRHNAKKQSVRIKVQETRALIEAKASVFVEGQKIIEAIKPMEKMREETLEVRREGFQ